MARLVKILLVVVAAVVGLAAIAGVALFVFFDPNDFKEDISAAVKSATGRDLVIDGDISLSLFPWLAVEVGQTTLGNAEGFGDEPFLSFQQASLSVKVVPLLFSQEIEVGTASLDSLAVNLAVNSSGVNNWEDLGSNVEVEIETDGDEAAVSASSVPALDIESISVTDAKVSIHDDQAGTSTSVSGLTLNTGRIAAGSPFDVEAEFNFDSNPDDMGGQLSISGTFLLAKSNDKLDIEGLNISGNLRGVAPQPTDFNFDSRAISVDLGSESISLGELDMGVLGISLTATVEPFSYAGDPQPKASVQVNEFSLKELMQTVGVEAPETSDPNALQRVSFSADAAVGTEAIALSNMQLSLDDTTMTGRLSLPRTEDGALLFNLAVDGIIIDHYMAPASEEDVAAAEPGEANIEIPVELIRAFNADGKLTMQKATLAGLEFENMEVGLKSSGGKLRMHPISADMFDGAYQGDVRIDASGDTPLISVNENIVDVKLASLTEAMFGIQNVTGDINGSFVLSGRGADMDAIRQDLDGNVSFTLLNGEWMGTDVWHQMRVARAAFRQEQPPEPRLPPRTEFSEVSVSGTVTDGVLKSNDLLAELPFMRLTGKGRVNFVDATIDYSMDARVVEQPEFTGQMTEAELKDFTAASIPLIVSGPLASPSIKPDLEGLARQQLEKEADKQINKLLDRLIRGRDKKKSAGDPEGNREP